MRPHPRGVHFLCHLMASLDRSSARPSTTIETIWRLASWRIMQGRDSFIATNAQLANSPLVVH